MSYADSAQITFTDMLGTLHHLVTKAQGAGVSDAVLTNKLAADMFPLELQFRVAINQVLLALNQVSGQKVPLQEATYRSFSDVRDGIAAARSHIERTEKWADADAIVDLTLPNGVRFVMSAEEDIRDWIMPNFYFHITMVYALLRKEGLAIGKMDFLPHMVRHILSDD